MIAWFVFYPKYQKERALERAQAVAEAQANAAEAAAQKQKSIPALPPAPAVETPVPAPVTETAAVTEKAAEVLPEQTTGEILTLSNGKLEIRIDPVTGGLESATLLNFKNAKDHEQLVTGLNDGKYRMFQLEIPGAKLLSVSSRKTDAFEFQLIRTYSNGLQVIQTITLSADGYNLGAAYSLVNSGKEALNIPDAVFWAAGLPPTQFFAGDKIYSERHNIDYSLLNSKNLSSEPESLDPSAKDEKFAKFSADQPVSWVGTTNKYFASLLFAKCVPGNAGMKTARLRKQDPDDAKETYVVPSIGIQAELVIPAQESIACELTGYFGPKEIAEIAKLDKTVMDAMHFSYFSWFEFLARPMIRLLVWLYGICHSYGWAIVILTLIVRLIFWPVTQKANTSMRKMQKLKPKMDEIREKYKSNPQEMNMRMMELYRTEKVSPLGGCLPILLQIPVFFALYSALDSAVELRQVSFLWCTDLAKPDLIGPQIDLPFFGPTGLHPLVIAMTVLMIIQQKMTPSNMDPAQQKMMMAMPLIMLFMLYNLPSGLTLYWTVSQLFSILQMKYGLIAAQREEAKEKASPAKHNA